MKILVYPMLKEFTDLRSAREYAQAQANTTGATSEIYATHCNAGVEFIAHYIVMPDK